MIEKLKNVKISFFQLLSCLAIEAIVAMVLMTLFVSA